MNKSVLAQFLSSCLSLFLLDLLLGSHRDLHFYANLFIAISSAIELLYQLVLPSWVGREVRRWWRYRGKGAEEAVGKFQCQLNKEFEYPEYELAKRYSYYVYKVMVAVFFAYPAPLGVFITLLTLALMYWIDKVNLFARSSLYYAGNLSVSNHALRMLQFSLLLYAASIFFFASSSQGSLNVPALCGLIVAFLYELLVLAAPAQLGRVIFGREAAADRFIYDECVGDGKFNETYWSRNPATMLVEEQSVTGKEMVTNPALLRRFAQVADYQNLF
ncbi:hypothetical protein DAPPUDRAFT_344353 [Daphnia pulex]|uniref:Anoctamin n=1 Tax=Daphnia pulex TaxID=6669 RepID=E9I6W7_DAPPU|nr:hypothetical protein DAPPUDRAFT_344353 [Daphnia pulex]|eukprot:EFX60263.1 hypothetical protein DAPPUDRAFT_344353 [Daphnia pulex]